MYRSPLNWRNSSAPKSDRDATTRRVKWSAKLCGFWKNTPPLVPPSWPNSTGSLAGASHPLSKARRLTPLRPVRACSANPASAGSRACDRLHLSVDANFDLDARLSVVRQLYSCYKISKEALFWSLYVQLAALPIRFADDGVFGVTNAVRFSSYARSKCDSHRNACRPSECGCQGQTRKAGE